MDVDNTTEKAERKALRISVNMHLDDTSSVSVEKVDGSIWIALGGWGYPSAAIHLSSKKLAEFRDVISVYLEGGK